MATRYKLPKIPVDASIAITAAKTLTVPLDASVSGSNTGDQTLPVKATGAEVNTGTDDAKFATAKAIADSYLYAPGIVQMFGGSTAPTGYLICDGSAVSRTTYANLFAVISTTFGVGDNSTTFNIPDFRGIFPKGAGTTNRAVGKDASGNFFAGILGTYLTDKMQGHWHSKWYRGLMTSAAGTTESYDAGNRAAVVAQNASAYDDYVRQPISDGTNGTPRTGHTTEPQSLGITFIIKT